MEAECEQRFLYACFINNRFILPLAHGFYSNRYGKSSWLALLHVFFNKSDFLKSFENAAWPRDSKA